ncbi:glycosyltransferase [Cesiribacter sp. SM1]|uniref:glycosyltransferase n=1 Tax=Cesiribacter sp. SM1 TaxID=2861196 RepID=UPI001CD242F1|nr:glycosyltransferase [Cesiribacter sp. SM1]
MNILFVVPYPEGEAPSQRFRFEQYFDILKEEGHRYTVASFLDLETWRILYKSGNGSKKALGIAKGFLRRIALLPSIYRYDWVFIHREAAPLGPPLFEWLITKVFRKRVIYDFDDAIWLPNTSEQNKLAAGLKWHQKVASICRWSTRVSCGNDYLANWARQYNNYVVTNPTTIDTVHLHNRLKEHRDGPVILGWTGTHSTLKYLKLLEPVLNHLATKYQHISFLIISNHTPDLRIPRLEFRKWNKETEADDLLKMDIGLMPLTADKWSEGKCGFKALQYMALGVPSVVSPVGVNKTIIQHNKNGYLADSPEEWESSISRLIEDTYLRCSIGKRARASVEAKFSVSANYCNYLNLFS